MTNQKDSKRQAAAAAFFLQYWLANPNYIFCISIASQGTIAENRQGGREMERNFETVMIEQCAPVLAGLKPAGLFRYETRDCADLARRVRSWNEQLDEKGLCVRVLKGCMRTHQYLVYVYRESRLRVLLAQPQVRDFLRGEGYDLPQQPDDDAPLLRQLSRRLCCEADFPHEIGVFLGYPLPDVVGFIENEGRNFTCCGCWKAYGDPSAAQRHFAQLNKCTAVYLRLFRNGTPIQRLAVAA